MKHSFEFIAALVAQNVQYRKIRDCQGAHLWWCILPLHSFRHPPLVLDARTVIALPKKAAE